MKAGRFDKLPSIKLSSEVGNPSISHASEEAPAVRLSALEDSGIKPNIIRPVNGVSKVVDENGEPLKVYRGAEFNPVKQPDGKGVIKPMSYFVVIRLIL